MFTSKIGYFHGRFQPFHRGHLAVVKYAINNCDLLAIGISNPFRAAPIVDKSFSSDAIESITNARISKNNPWPYWARILMIHEGLRCEEIDLERVLFLPNLNNTGLPVDEVRFPKENSIVFIGEKESHNKTISRNYREEGWNVVVVPILENGVSSRMIRERMALGEPWEHLVPDGTAKIIKSLSIAVQ